MLWDVSTRQELATINNRSAVTAVAFSPEGKTLASGSYDQTVRLWDVSTRQLRAMIEGHNTDRGNLEPFSVAFSPDGRTLASASKDGVVTLWFAATNEEVAAQRR